MAHLFCICHSLADVWDSIPSLLSINIFTIWPKKKLGIIAKVCTYLAENQINILDISQTIVQGYFNMMMITDMGATEKEFGIVADELEKLGFEIGVTIRCQRAEIFEKMHRL